jgi:hypothetical protein
MRSVPALLLPVRRASFTSPGGKAGTLMTGSTDTGKLFPQICCGVAERAIQSVDNTEPQPKGRCSSNRASPNGSGGSLTLPPPGFPRQPDPEMGARSMKREVAISYYNSSVCGAFQSTAFAIFVLSACFLAGEITERQNCAVPRSIGPRRPSANPERKCPDWGFGWP